MNDTRRSLRSSIHHSIPSISDLILLLLTSILLQTNYSWWWWCPSRTQSPCWMAEIETHFKVSKRIFQTPRHFFSIPGPELNYPDDWLSACAAPYPCLYAIPIRRGYTQPSPNACIIFFYFFLLHNVIYIKAKAHRIHSSGFKRNANKKWRGEWIS